MISGMSAPEYVSLKGAHQDGMAGLIERGHLVEGAFVESVRHFHLSAPPGTCPNGSWRAHTIVPGRPCMACLGRLIVGDIP